MLSCGCPRMQPPRLVVVFIVGGSTYEEARAVAEANAAGAMRRCTDSFIPLHVVYPTSSFIQILLRGLRV